MRFSGNQKFKIEVVPSYTNIPLLAKMTKIETIIYTISVTCWMCVKVPFAVMGHILWLDPTLGFHPYPFPFPSPSPHHFTPHNRVQCECYNHDLPVVCPDIRGATWKEKERRNMFIIKSVSLCYSVYSFIHTWYYFWLFFVDNSKKFKIIGEKTKNPLIELNILYMINLAI